MFALVWASVSVGYIVAMPQSTLASVHMRYLRETSVKPRACTALIVALKLVMEPAGTVTLRTFASQVPLAPGSVT